MKRKLLYAIWAVLYIFSVGFGTLPAEGIGKVFFLLTALLFFVPGFLLLIDSIRSKNRRGLLLIRYLSLASLLCTVGAFVGVVATASASAAVGKLWSDILLLVSAPMICAQNYVLSLFLWACLFVGSFLKPQEKG